VSAQMNKVKHENDKMKAEYREKLNQSQSKEFDLKALEQKINKRFTDKLTNVVDKMG
jgi:hypothetical protein